MCDISVLRSGRWKGYYLQVDQRHGFTISLDIQPDGTISGSGTDDDNKDWNKDGFVINGKWNSADSSITFTKSYVRTANVYYRGRIDSNNRNTISGNYYFQLNGEPIDTFTLSHG